jgi:hypothetical protein
VFTAGAICWQAARIDLQLAHNHPKQVPPSPVSHFVLMSVSQALPETLQVKIIESTVPRPSVETLEERKRALRRVRTDPADCEAHITHALLSEGLDIAALAAQVWHLVPSSVLSGFGGWVLGSSGFRALGCGVLS